VNNAVARTAQLIAVAALPAAVGLSGADYQDARALADGFHAAMHVAAAVAAAGGLLAWATIRSDVLATAPEPARLQVAEQCAEHHCAVAGTPLRSAPRAGAAA
jgi:hypothetical protein